MTDSQPDGLTPQDRGVAREPEPNLVGTPAGAEQQASWLELFFDLIFVTAFDQLAKRLGDSPDLENLLEFGLMFTVVWWAWAGNTAFAARYGNESRTYRWGTLLQLVSLGLIALTLRGDVRDTGLYFALAFSVNRLIQLAMYVQVARSGQPAAPFARRMSLSFGLSAAVWLFSAFLPAGSAPQVGLWVAALLIEMLTPVVTRQHGAAALPHEEHLPERVGLLQIIALGAVVTEVVNGSRQQELNWATLLPALAGMLVAVGLWRLYFDQARALPLLSARLEGHAGRMLVWLYGHLPFTLAVIMLGVGVGHSISAVDAKKDAIHQQFVFWSLAGAFVTLAFLRWNSRRAGHLESMQHARLDRSLLALLLGAALVGGLAFLDLDTVQVNALAATLTLLLALVVATDPATRQLGQLEDQASQELEENRLPEVTVEGRTSSRLP